MAGIIDECPGEVLRSDMDVATTSELRNTSGAKTPVKSDNTLMRLSFTRTLRFKVRAEAYTWLNAAAAEVNVVFNYCNETSHNAATRTDSKRKWLSGFDRCNLSAGATQHFDKIGRSRGRDRSRKGGGVSTGAV